jgi:hypothetical protein
MKALLWLDDIRDPKDTIWVDWMVENGIILSEFNITWVKSYGEFTKWIEKNSLPSLICFDHDLGEDVAKGRVSKGMSKRQARILKRETLSGFDCAKWLIEFCLDNELNAPDFKIQSANPVGAENIKGLIENFRKNVKF